MNKVKINLCPSPDLFSQYVDKDSKSLVIIVDILRATSSIVTAFGNGAKAVIPVSSVQECEVLGKEKGFIMAAERDTRKCDFADIGNDPILFTSELVKERTIVMTTTNGTRSIKIAKENSKGDILAGAFLNISATAKYIIDKGYTEVVVLSAGWKGQVSLEDCLYSGALSSSLQRLGTDTSLNDIAYIMDTIYKDKAIDINSRCKLVSSSEHYARLAASSLESSCRYCLCENVFDFVVLLSDIGRLIRL